MKKQMLPLNETPSSFKDSIKIPFSIFKKSVYLVSDDTNKYEHAPPKRTPFDFYLRCQAQAGFQTSLCHCQASRDVNQQVPQVLPKCQVHCSCSSPLQLLGCRTPPAPQISLTQAVPVRESRLTVSALRSSPAWPGASFLSRPCL